MNTAGSNSPLQARAVVRQVYSRSALPVMPWKNGGGSTCEIACWPPGSGLEDFAWRASIATIAADGPFSRFAGVDRHIALLAGAGVDLAVTDGSGITHALDQPGEPWALAGEWPVTATLRAGATEDFNVMSRRARCRARVALLEDSTDWPTAPHGLLHVVAGHWHARQSGHDEVLNPGEGLWWAAAPQAWTLHPLCPGARLLAVRWTDTPATATEKRP